MKKHCTAVILAAGSGKRMQSSTAKQFMLLDGKPLIWYALHAVENSDIIDQCILVTGAHDIDFVRREIVEYYGFHKVVHILAGGSERWESVANVIAPLDGSCYLPKDGYVFIHDGARPFLTEKILRDTFADAVQYGACVAAVPSKDTVKISDSDGFALNTPDRRNVWIVQTPQVFLNAYAMEAYECLRKDVQRRGKEQITVTDDASVVEQYLDKTVKMTVSSYRNIKITTPEDICIADIFCHQKE
ncbi:MAG: 2-C-methyl-D-erythritol 4-phosphate cytidylyltransferase [Acetatifactor sp.]